VATTGTGAMTSLPQAAQSAPNRTTHVLHRWWLLVHALSAAHQRSLKPLTPLCAQQAVQQRRQAAAGAVSAAAALLHSAGRQRPHPAEWQPLRRRGLRHRRHGLCRLVSAAGCNAVTIGQGALVSFQFRAGVHLGHGTARLHNFDLYGACYLVPAAGGRSASSSRS
jgi:hypothetical protein